MHARENENRPARSLRQHLSNARSAHSATLERDDAAIQIIRREELLADVAQEASNIEYERWDGMS